MAFSSRGSGRGILVSLSLVVVLAGCQARGLRLTAEQEKIRSELAEISPWGDSLAENSPIIDIHTHTFNARYLPLRGILLGKRDAVPPITWLISDSCAATLASTLIERTELGAAAGQPAVARRNAQSHSHEHRDQGLICRIFLGLLDKAAANGCWQEGLSPREQLARLDQVADRMNMQERIAVMTATRMMGMDDRLKGQNKTNALRAAVRFLWFLTQSDAEMTRLFGLQYEGAPMRATPLLVSHMMDLAPVYNQEPNGELLDFAKQQVKRMEIFQNRPDSHMLYFAAYTPYRDYWMGGKPGDALNLVRSAVEEHGAWGVKVYPPSGYRPAGNVIKRRPTGIRARIAGQQWDARYGPLGDDRDAALNQRLTTFLLWCIENDVPVFVHSGTGEFEARKGYGGYHSDPRFWREFLDNNPSADGSPCRLRLCLGHAGGEDFWFGGTKYSEWGKQVYEMCRRFPNVYSEITTHANFVDTNKQAFFVDRLANLFDDSRRDDNGKPYSFSFSKKLIYGTDWYLPDAAERDQVLLATQRAFLHGKLRGHYKDYFFGNALRYLNAKTRLDDKRRPVPAAVQNRLEQVLALSSE